MEDIVDGTFSMLKRLCGLYSVCKAYCLYVLCNVENKLFFGCDNNVDVLSKGKGVECHCESWGWFLTTDCVLELIYDSIDLVHNTKL